VLKDIPENTVENIAMAIVSELSPEGDQVWNVYLLNLKEELIEGVLVTSKGYGIKDGEQVRTSTLRHFLDVVPSKGYVKVEPIIEKVFGLNNEYWVSFYQNKVMYDKKYLFLPESVRPDNFITVPIINKVGVMIK
jgi:hypothetical protein